MTHSEAIEILRKHNEWRRYNGPIGEGPEMQHPALIGKAIDTIVAGEDNKLSDIEQFRREAAKDILAGMVHTFTSIEDSYMKRGVEVSIKLADELIKQLKQDEK
jgi:hypothetical protein